MDNKLIEIHEYHDAGFAVPVISGDWRIGVLNYCTPFGKETLDNYERHFETDEVFVLLSGSATLFIGDGDAEFGNIRAIEMKPCTVYNIRKNTWHTQFMSPDCSILVVENDGTGLDNSEVRNFGKEFRSELYKHLKQG